jgi:plastocyanin
MDGSSVLQRLPAWAFVVVVPLIAAIAVLVTGFGDDDGGTARAVPDGAIGVVAIRNFTYAPDPARARAGEPITVTNDDGVVHTVTATKGGFDTGDIAGGARAEIVVDEPGTHAYFCRLHQYMKGTIDVD